MTGSEKPLLRALAGQASAMPPIWLMRQAGRYLAEYRAVRAQAGSFLDLCFTPELAAAVTLQPVLRFGLDAAILFSDILVVPHALGRAVAYVEGEGPQLVPIRDAAAIGALQTGGAAERLGPVYETVARVKAALPPPAALIGFAGGAWTVAAYMIEGSGSRDFIEARRFALADPASFARLIDILVETTTEYLARQAAAGAEALQLFDSWAGVLDEDGFDRWVIAPTRRIVAGLRARCPGIPVIGFPRGAGLMLDPYADGTGVAALGLDTAVPVGQARRLQARLPVQGNLDPVALLAGGPALDAALDRLAPLRQGPWIFNLGHGVHKDTPPAHIERLVGRIRGWGG